MIDSQPKLDWEDTDILFGFGWHSIIGVAIICFGQVFVISSFYRLGITGTFLGDYCGILLDEPIRGFPFNVLDNPMYVGSTLSFLGSSIRYFQIYNFKQF